MMTSYQASPVAHAGESEPLGVFYAAALFGGVAVYIAGHMLFANRMHYQLHVGRLITAGVLLAALPAAALLPPLAVLALLVVIFAGLITAETLRYAEVRRALRST